MPYRGGAPLLTDMLGGVIPVSFNVLGEVLPSIQSGKLRSLAICSAERSPFLPDVPTLGEQGYKDIAVTEWLGWFLPAKTPPEIVNKLNALVRDVLQTPEMAASLANSALEPDPQTPENFAALVKRDYDNGRAIVKATGFTMTE